MRRNTYLHRCAFWILFFSLIWLLAGCTTASKGLPEQSFVLPPKPSLYAPVSNDSVAAWMLSIDQYADFCTEQMKQIKQLNEDSNDR